MHLQGKILTTYFVLQSLHKALPSTTLYYKACTQYFSVLLRTTKLAQSTSQYYFVQQSLHKVNSQYYFVLQSLHKVLLSTTSYYKACTKYFPVLLRTAKLAQSKFPVLLRTTKLAQSTSQYYFVLQSLHKVRPSIALYYRACTKCFPALLRTTKLAQSTSQYYFVPVWILSPAAASTLHGKTQGFVLRFSTQIKPHATRTQLLQCVLQHHVANPHLFTHMATQHENIHANTTLRSTNTDSRTPYNTHKRTQSRFNPPSQCGNNKTSK